MASGGIMKSVTGMLICVLASAVIGAACGSADQSTIPDSTLAQSADNSATATIDGSDGSEPSGVTVANDTAGNSTVSSNPAVASSNPSSEQPTPVDGIEPEPNENASDGSATSEQTTTTAFNPATVTPAQIEAEMNALLEKMLSAWATCTSNPPACDVPTTLGTVYDGQLLAVASAEIGQRAATGQRTLPPANPANNSIELIEIRMESIASEVASITYCHIDGSVLVQAGAGGSDIVLNDSVASITREADVERNQSGGWRMVSRRSTKLFENANGCNQ